MGQWYDHQAARHEAGRIKEATLRNYGQAAKVWRGSELADVLVTSLTADAVEAETLGWERAGVFHRRASHHYTKLLAAAWRWGAARGHCPALAIPLPSLPRPEDTVQRHHTPSRDEVRRMLAETPEGPARDAVQVAALTGARLGEALALTAQSYDPRRRTLLLDGKTGPRLWPVAGELQLLLEQLVAAHPEGLLLPVSMTTVREQMLAACRAARVPECTPHGLRRMVATELVQRTDPKTVSKLTGHSVYVLLRHYVVPSADSLRDAVLRASLDLQEGPKVVHFRPQTAGTHRRNTD